jgi:hypothetical protein
MPTAVDFLSGKGSRFKVTFNNTFWLIKTKTWKITENATLVADDVNGEDRSRLQKLINFYDAAFDCYEDGAVSQILQSIVTNQKNEDASFPQLPMSGGILFNQLDGSRQGFSCINCTLGPMSFGSGGRTERIMHNLSFRFQYFQSVKTV